MLPDNGGLWDKELKICNYENSYSGKIVVIGNYYYDPMGNITDKGPKARFPPHQQKLQ